MPIQYFEFTNLIQIIIYFYPRKLSIMILQVEYFINGCTSRSGWIFSSLHSQWLLFYCNPCVCVYVCACVCVCVNSWFWEVLEQSEENTELGGWNRNWLCVHIIVTIMFTLYLIHVFCIHRFWNKLQSQITLIIFFSKWISNSIYNNILLCNN